MNYFDMTDLLAMLKDGQDAECIAKDFTAALNEAIQKKKEEEFAATQTRARKHNDLEDLINLAIDFLNTHYPKLLAHEGDKIKEKIDVDEVIKIMDQAYAETADAMSLLTKINNKPEKVDPINDFLNKYNLL